MATLALALASMHSIASDTDQIDGLLAAEESLQEIRTLGLAPTPLRFVLETSGFLPVLASEDISPVRYGPEEIRFNIDGRLICLNSKNEAGASAVRLMVKNADNHPVIDAGLASESIFAYYPVQFGSASGGSVTPAPTIFADFNRKVYCFYDDIDGKFGLFGAFFDSPEVIFATRFEADEDPGDDPRTLEIRYENLSAEQIAIGDNIDFTTRRLNYELVVENLGSETIDSIALQELVPFNRDFFSATFTDLSNNELSDTLFACALENADNSSQSVPCGQLVASGDFLRGPIEIAGLEGGQRFRITVSNRIASRDSFRGSFLNLTAAAVATDFEGSGVPAHDVAEANIWIVGLGSWIAASANSAQPSHEVRALDAEQEGVGISVRSWDSEPADPARGVDETSTVPKAGIPVEITEVQIRCIEALDGSCEGQPWLDLSANPDDPGRWGLTGLEQDAIFLVTPASGTTEFVELGEEALINFEVYATAAREFRLTFSVPVSERTANGILDSDGAMSTVVLSFVSAEPSNLQVPTQIEAQANSCAQFQTQVSDAFGNPVAGVTVSVNTDSIVVPADGCNSTPALTGPNGIATLVAGSRLTGAFNLTFSTSPEEGNLAGDSTLNVDPGPIHLLRITEFTLRNGCVPDQDNCVIPINETMERLALRVEDQWGNTVNSFAGSLGLGIRAGVNVFGIFAEGAEPSFVGGELTIEAIDIPEIDLIIGSSRRLTASIVTPEDILRLADTATFEVTKAMPELTLELDPAIGVVGESITAKIALSGALDATGVVEISSTSSSADGCTISLPLQSCDFTISSSNGPFDITASYSGDDTFNAGAEAVIEGYEVIPPLALTIDGNNEVVVDNEEVYTVSLVNNSVTLSDNVEILFEITPLQSGQGARGTADPVELSYCADSESADAPDDCVWLPLALTQNNGTLTGRFGPEDGFPVPEGYNASTFIQAVFNQAGSYGVDVSVVSLADSDGVLAADSISIEASAGD